MKILLDEPLSNYTFTVTGGKADMIIFPKNSQEIKEILKVADQENIPVTFLGNASNLIIKDGGIRGITIISTDIDDLRVDKNKIIASAGVPIIEVAKVAQANGLKGLEFAAGIPGSVGGAAYMNAGAYGGEVKDVISRMVLIDLSGKIRTFSGADLDFGYRHSVAQDVPGMIIEVEFNLLKGDKLSIQKEMDRVNKLRSDKQPLEYPSCGSVFKRPVGHYTGPLIQNANLQGKMIGGAQVSTKHAGFIVNIDHATATDYIKLIQLIQKTVKEKFDVDLETEVKIIGEDD